jgi:hypothetical protein
MPARYRVPRRFVARTSVGGLVDVVAVPGEWVRQLDFFEVGIDEEVQLLVPELVDPTGARFGLGASCVARLTRRRERADMAPGEFDAESCAERIEKRLDRLQPILTLPCSVTDTALGFVGDVEPVAVLVRYEELSSEPGS